jgi:hypothetical protein
MFPCRGCSRNCGNTSQENHRCLCSLCGGVGGGTLSGCEGTRLCLWVCCLVVWLLFENCIVDASIFISFLVLCV